MTLIAPAELRTVRIIDADGRVVGVRQEYRIVQVDIETGLPASMGEWMRVDAVIVDEHLPAGTTVDDLIDNLPPVTPEET